MSDSSVSRSHRNLRALLALGFLIAFVATAGGALLFALAYLQPSAQQPLWKFGQYAMFFGLINLAIYFGISFQIRRLGRGSVGSDAT